MNDRKSFNRPEFSEPQYSRLFIVCSKDLSSDDIYKHFDKFGKIEEVRVVKDRQTGDSKGIVYVKFAKTSEAAKALEEMNGKYICGSSRPIKVLVASSRDQGSRREQNEGEKYVRLFVVTSKSMKEEELENYFKQFGQVQFVTVIRDKGSGESKGFAYITFENFYQAALAFENCDRTYRAVFAEPKPNKKERSFDRSTPSYGNNEYYLGRQEMQNDVGCQQLIVTASPASNQDQLWRLFDLIPGLDYCQPSGTGRHNGNVYLVVYNSSKSATIARDKLHGFEYPPGYRLIVKLDMDGPSPMGGRGGGGGSGDHLGLGGGPGGRGPSASSILPPEVLSSRPDIAHLAETIAQATSLIQAAGINISQFTFGSKPSGGDSMDSQCSVKLPPSQPLAHVDAPVAKRCFIVCSPQPPPVGVLRDAFGRFGDLIDVYMLSHRNCGYVKYASVRAAEDAIKVLHGAELCGIRLKVLEAEEQRRSDSNDRSKRQKRSFTPNEEENEGWTGKNDEYDD